MFYWFQAGHNKIISDKVGIVVIVARGAWRDLRADSKRLMWLSFPFACIRSPRTGLGRRSHPDRSD